MIELYKGHLYELDNLKGEGKTFLQFYQDPELHERGEEGPSTQEVIRACIARVKSLDDELHWEGNAEIIFHLRKAIALFEIRALLRRIEKGYPIENIKTEKDGHVFKSYRKPLGG